MTKIITSAEAHARRNRDIQPLIKRLKALHPQADPNVLTRFARGLAALSGIPGILNAEGLRLLKYTRGIALAERPPLTDIESVLPQLPSIDNPQLHLFLEPFPEEVLNDPQFRAFRAWFNEEGGYRYIQIATDCQNYCLMCAASPHAFGEKQGKIRFMPFPMVLLLAKQLLTKEAKEKIELYDYSEIWQWKDRNFDADFGDLAKKLIEMGIPLGGQVTLGFLPGNIYAEEAAKKCVELQMIFELSVHLLHKTIFPTPQSRPQQKWLEIYAARFAHAINALRPRRVRLLADQYNPNVFMGHDYLEKFYNTMVFPLINDQLKFTYRRTGHRVSMNNFNYEGRAHNNPYFPENSTIWHSLCPKGFHLKIGPYGEPIILVYSSKTNLDPQLSSAQTVRERYPDADSREFKDFLRKLRFVLSDRALKETNETVILWKKLFPGFKAKEILEQLSSDDIPVRVLKILHRRLRDLPVVSQEFFYKFRVADLTDREESEIGPYIHSMFYNTEGIVRDRDFSSFDLEGKQNNIWAALIKEGYIIDKDGKGILRPKFLRETKFLTKKRNFKLFSLHVGSVPDIKILKVFGEDDISWKEFFENPESEDLVFKRKAKEQIEAADMPEDKKQGLLAIWRQFITIQELGYIFKTLQSAYYGNIEYRFLMSFEEGRNAIQKILESESLVRVFPSGRKQCNYDLKDEFYEILKDLPILQPVTPMKFRPDVTHPRTEVILGFRANTGIT